MLELRAICKTWEPQRGQRRALLSGVHLKVAAGQSVAILGASGSGKSTLLKIIAGIEPPDSGSVLLDGKDITTMPPEKRHFALMFQDFALFAHLNVLDNVAFGLVEQGRTRTHARELAQAMLQRFGMQDFGTARVWTLSGGEQQRVALARALITQPRVLLMDEPFSALDVELRLRLREEFLAHISAHGVAAVWVTHDPEEARAAAQVGLQLQEGQLRLLWGSV